jgi:hypothetical protein
MAAAAATTVATAEVVGGGEDHQALRIEIEIVGGNFLGGGIFAGLLVELGDAIAADAGFVAQLGRDLFEQGFGKFDGGAPALAFVGGRGAELAVVFTTAQRAKRGVGWRRLRKVIPGHRASCRVKGSRCRGRRCRRRHYFGCSN